MANVLETAIQLTPTRLIFIKGSTYIHNSPTDPNILICRQSNAIVTCWIVLFMPDHFKNMCSKEDVNES